jgi:hypothetical protein
MGGALRSLNVAADAPNVPLELPPADAPEIREEV